MGRRLYLHETVDIVGQGQYEYMEHLWKDPVLRMPEMFGLQGSFYVCAAGGGRWPQVINIWDVGSQGWMGWASNVDRMNLKRRKAFYGDWWDEAAKWRSGGFDRLCGGVPGCPTTEEIMDAGVRGTLFVNEILTVRPGAPLDFLAAVAEDARAAHARVRPRAHRALRGAVEPARGRDGVGHRHPVTGAAAPEPRRRPRALRRRRGRRPPRRSGSAPRPSSSPAATPTS